jgi:hypothetical protein
MIRNWSLLMMTLGFVPFIAVPSHAAGYSPQVGQLHPDFTLPNIANNEPLSLSQFHGRKVLLIHFSSW